jgi:hypothetical protein
MLCDTYGSQRKSLHWLTRAPRHLVGCEAERLDWVTRRDWFAPGEHHKANRSYNAKRAEVEN